ncbi:hypothetical protein SUGI_0278260 [Cryptomeria japonica]|nr:hypothetical protein SUGI_0278260 [Cryptomeria japonica]
MQIYGLSNKNWQKQNRASSMPRAFNSNNNKKFNYRGVRNSSREETPHNSTSAESWESAKFSHHSLSLI